MDALAVTVQPMAGVWQPPAKPMAVDVRVILTEFGSAEEKPVVLKRKGKGGGLAGLLKMAKGE